MHLPVSELVKLVEGAHSWLTPGSPPPDPRVTLGPESLQGQPCPCFRVRAQPLRQQTLIYSVNDPWSGALVCPGTVLGAGTGFVAVTITCWKHSTWHMAGTWKYLTQG